MRVSREELNLARARAVGGCVQELRSVAKGNRDWEYLSFGSPPESNPRSDGAMVQTDPGVWRLDPDACLGLPRDPKPRVKSHITVLVEGSYPVCGDHTIYYTPERYELAKQMMLDWDALETWDWFCHVRLMSEERFPKFFAWDASKGIMGVVNHEKYRRLGYYPAIWRAFECIGLATLLSGGEVVDRLRPKLNLENGVLDGVFA